SLSCVMRANDVILIFASVREFIVDRHQSSAIRKLYDFAIRRQASSVFQQRVRAFIALGLRPGFATIARPDNIDAVRLTLGWIEFQTTSVISPQNGIRQN